MQRSKLDELVKHHEVHDVSEPDGVINLYMDNLSLIQNELIIISINHVSHDKMFYIMNKVFVHNLQCFANEREIQYFALDKNYWYLKLSSDEFICVSLKNGKTKSSFSGRRITGNVKCIDGAMYFRTKYDIYSDAYFRAKGNGNLKKINEIKYLGETENAIDLNEILKLSPIIEDKRILIMKKKYHDIRIFCKN